MGESIEVQLRVLPHGVAGPEVFVGTQSLSIVAVNVDTGRELRVQALPDEASRTYRASMTFPEAGAWKWSATDGGYVVATPLPPFTVTTDGTAAHMAATANVVKIAVRDGSFSMPDSPIHVGDTIEWTNTGSLTHVVMSSDRGFEDVPMLHPGDTYRTTASVAGSFAIFCTPHPGMVATLVVGK